MNENIKYVLFCLKSKTFGDKSRRLELRFRPDDPHCKPTCGERVPTTSYLLRVKVMKRKKRENNQGLFCSSVFVEAWISPKKFMSRLTILSWQSIPFVSNNSATRVKSWKSRKVYKILTVSTCLNSLAEFPNLKNTKNGDFLFFLDILNLTSTK